MGSIAKAEHLGRGVHEDRDRRGGVSEQLGRLVVRGWALLLAAAVLVGIAIALDSSVGRALNGLGGVMWLVGAILLVLDARRSALDPWTWLALAVTVVTLSWLLSPRDLGTATLGFATGGTIVMMVGRPRADGMNVVGLLPALWLPTHLSIAAGKAIYLALLDHPAAIRTDPPPTASLVPLAMVVAALTGGLVARTLTERTRRPTEHP